MKISSQPDFHNTAVSHAGFHRRTGQFTKEISGSLYDVASGKLQGSSQKYPLWR